MFQPDIPGSSSDCAIVVDDSQNDPIDVDYDASAHGPLCIHSNQTDLGLAVVNGRSSDDNSPAEEISVVTDEEGYRWQTFGQDVRMLCNYVQVLPSHWLPGEKGLYVTCTVEPGWILDTVTSFEHPSLPQGPNATVHTSGDPTNMSIDVGNGNRLEPTEIGGNLPLAVYANEPQYLRNMGAGQEMPNSMFITGERHAILVSMKRIEKGQEVLVWYGEKYVRIGWKVSKTYISRCQDAHNAGEHYLITNFQDLFFDRIQSK